ncbi:MAG: glycosyltransferase family 2 protein [Flavobacteriales bacterium]|jgi:glycosyltransferase involved in cell wall biosynthesis
MPDRVSVIVPCYQETAHIGRLAENLIGQDYPAELLEVLFADGGSTDGTWEKLETLCDARPHWELLDNPDKYVPQALNACIRKSTGSVIVRMDAHSEYPPDYISRLVEALNRHGADNVGGIWITEPGDDTPEARAIALASTHPLGIGNARYRLGANRDERTDTVPYGCFRRSLFDRIGLFDEELIRNQDDEFNGRIIRNGGSIWLIPSVRIRYKARPTREKLSAMFYQYGFFKPLVNRKLGAPATLRQFAPPLLVLSGALALLLVFIWPSRMWLFVMWCAGYAIGIAAVSASLAARHGWSLFPHLLLTFPSIHFSYGFGYLSGLIRWSLFRKSEAQVGDNR